MICFTLRQITFLCLIDILCSTAVSGFGVPILSKHCATRFCFSIRHMHVFNVTESTSIDGLQGGDASYEKFFSNFQRIKEGKPSCIGLINEGNPLFSEDEEDFININSLVFEIQAPSHLDKGAYILAVLSASDRVNLTALEAVVEPWVEGNERGPTIALAPSDKVKSLCGFAPGTIPPFSLNPEPMLTIVEDSLIKNAHDPEHVRLRGGGGLPNQTCWMTLGTLLREAKDIRTANFRQKESVGPLLSLSTPRDSFLNVDDLSFAGFSNPYFIVAPPLRASAEQVLEQKDLPNPFRPVAFAMVGRISGVRRMASRLAFCDFAPALGEFGPQDRPWLCPITGEPMAVQLIAGKTLCSWAERNGVDGSAAIKQLKVGQLVMIYGKTNVGNRDSLKNWVTKTSLDVVVFSFQHVSNPDPTNHVEPQPANVSNSRREFKSMPQLSDGDRISQVPYLSMADLFSSETESETTSLAVTIVDNLEKVRGFAADLSGLLLSLATKDANHELQRQTASEYPVSLVGIDCEWRPNIYMEDTHAPQPVLVLQVFMRALKHVYIFDLQSLIRPLMPCSEPMTEVEESLSNVFEELFLSKRLIKVGFQIPHDLRRVAASYPHVPAFHIVNSVLEVSTFAKKVMHLIKLRNSRLATSSLGRLSERFLGRALDKNQQCSDWSQRPLTDEQIEYAALDAVVAPLIAEKLIDSVDVTFHKRPYLGRWDGDTAFSSLITSWRFLFLGDVAEMDAIQKLKAKRIVGPSYVMTQKWVTGNISPLLPSLPTQRDGPYTDITGTYRVPSQMVSIKGKDFPRLLESLLGERLGKSKDKCLANFLEKSPDFPQNARLDFPQRSGIVEFQDAVTLFVNMPTKPRNTQRKSYPNEWLEDGNVLTWFLRGKEWQHGSSKIAKKLLSAPGGADEVVTLLFVRLGKEPFVCCGRCQVVGPTDETNDASEDDWKLVKLHLILEDWAALYLKDEFQHLVNPGQFTSTDGQAFEFYDSDSTTSSS